MGDYPNEWVKPSIVIMCFVKRINQTVNGFLQSKVSQMTRWGCSAALIWLSLEELDGDASQKGTKETTWLKNIVQLVHGALHFHFHPLHCKMYVCSDCRVEKLMVLENCQLLIVWAKHCIDTSDIEGSSLAHLLYRC